MGGTGGVGGGGPPGGGGGGGGPGGEEREEEDKVQREGRYVGERCPPLTRTPTNGAGGKGSRERSGVVKDIGEEFPSMDTD